MANNVLKAFSIVVAMFCLCGCHSDDDDTWQAPTREAYFFNSLSGPGDNGYNDIILEAEMHFVNAHKNVSAHFLSPQDEEYAEAMYELIMSLSSNGDSTLVVFNGSDYSAMVRKVGNIGTGVRVLLFEDEGIGLPKGVTTFSIQRYGASYVAGRLFSNAPALIVAARTDDPQLEDAIQGFRNGYAVAGNPSEVFLACLSSSIKGFDVPNQAVALCETFTDMLIPASVQAGVVAADDSTGLCIYPLAGGSNIGVYSYVNTLPPTWKVNAIGTDKSYNDLTRNIPLSMVTNMAGIINAYLEQWVSSETWPEKASYGLDSDYPFTMELSKWTSCSLLQRLASDTVIPLADDVAINDTIRKYIEEAKAKEQTYVKGKEDGK